MVPLRCPHKYCFLRHLGLNASILFSGVLHADKGKCCVYGAALYSMEVV